MQRNYLTGPVAQGTRNSPLNFDNFVPECVCVRSIYMSSAGGANTQIRTEIQGCVGANINRDCTRIQMARIMLRPLGGRGSEVQGRGPVKLGL